MLELNYQGLQYRNNVMNTKKFSLKTQNVHKCIKMSNYFDAVDSPYSNRCLYYVLYLRNIFYSKNFK